MMNWVEPVRRLPDGSIIDHEEFMRRRRPRPAGPPVIFYEDREPHSDEYEQCEGFKILKLGTWVEVTEALPETAPEGSWCRIQGWQTEEHCFIDGRWLEDGYLRNYVTDEDGRYLYEIDEDL